jgi:hypothetical protein
MRKAELDRLLLAAVAEAIGQPVPKARRVRGKIASQQKRSTPRYRPTPAEHHAHA